MGSCQSTVVAAGAAGDPSKARVITIGGSLKEHSAPVSAFDVLGGERAATFICNSEKLYCGDYIQALEPEELLQPGQIYFVLPSAKLRYPLSREDMSALAVRASLALALAAKKCSRKRLIRVMPAVELEGDRTVGSTGMEVRRSTKDKVEHGGGSLISSAVVHQSRRMKRNRSVRGRFGRRNYRYPRVRLSTIPEIEE